MRSSFRWRFISLHCPTPMILRTAFPDRLCAPFVSAEAARVWLRYFWMHLVVIRSQQWKGFLLSKLIPLVLQKHITNCTTTTCEDRPKLLHTNHHICPPHSSSFLLLTLSVLSTGTVCVIKIRNLHRVSEKSSTLYFAEYFCAGLTDCKNFNGYRVRDNQRTQVYNQCFNF